MMCSSRVQTLAYHCGVCSDQHAKGVTNVIGDDAERNGAVVLKSFAWEVAQVLEDCVIGDRLWRLLVAVTTNTPTKHFLQVVSTKNNRGIV